MKTLEEAIKHCEEVAEKKEYIAETLEGFDEYTREECLECASEHRQLAEWLKELKEYRSKDKKTSCEDYVSRTQALEMLGDEPENWTDTEKEIQEVNDYRWFKSILENLPSVTPKTRWIPCTERLPEKDINVLAYHRNESFDYQYVSWIDDYSGKWAGFIGNLSDEVLAWMPLPENYKEGSK